MERRSSFCSSIGICIVTLALACGTQAQYSGGTGEPNAPYLIATAADLIALGQTPGDYDRHFVLTADIDLDLNLPGRRVFNEALIAPIRTIVRGVGIVDPIFMGVFDGNDHTISNLTIRGSGRLALFGASGYPAAITNLGLKDVDISGTGHDVGGLVNFNYGSITNCRSIGMISGSLSVGGLANMTYGSISGSYSEGVVNGTNWVGGLVGVAHGSISNCYSESVVRGYSDIGGLVGLNNGSISHSYSRGTVSGKEECEPRGIGGLVGSSSGSVTSCFWDTQVSGQIAGAGGTGLTTVQMQNIGTYLDAGWDFIGESFNGTCDFWHMPASEYPKLRYFSGHRSVLSEGQGTIHRPFLIRNPRDLGTVWLKPQAYYRLGTPLDLTGITWSTAVIPWFGGTFDGNGYVIRGLHIQGGGYLGLIGQLRSGATVLSLGVKSTDIHATGGFVGSVAGYSDGVVNGSCGEGIVSGGIYTGGLIGLNSGSITDSYCIGTVIGGSSVGSLVGRNSSGQVSNCYGVGTVTGDYDVGGLVGTSYAGSVLACFWDLRTSGQMISAGGTSKTTTEMQTADTFLDAKWDFMGETVNGVEDLWWIVEGNDYPRLWWELNEVMPKSDETVDE